MATVYDAIKENNCINHSLDYNCSPTINGKPARYITIPSDGYRFEDGRSCVIWRNADTIYDVLRYVKVIKIA